MKRILILGVFAILFLGIFTMNFEGNDAFAQYPPPPTEIGIPEFPQDYLYFNGSKVYAICPSCLNYSGDYTRLFYHFVYVVVGWPYDQWINYGVYVGLSTPSGYPVYAGPFAPPSFTTSSCVMYTGLIGYLDNHPAEPYFHHLIYLPGGFTSEFMLCRNYVPLSIR